MSDKTAQELVGSISELQDQEKQMRDTLEERIKTGEILSEDPEVIEDALNIVYEHSGDSQERLYSEMFHMRLQNLKNAGYSIDTRLTAIVSALVYSVNEGGAKSRRLASYLAAKSDESYESMLKINID